MTAKISIPIFRFRGLRYFFILVTFLGAPLPFREARSSPELFLSREPLSRESSRFRGTSLLRGTFLLRGTSLLRGTFLLREAFLSLCVRLFEFLPFANPTPPYKSPGICFPRLSCVIRSYNYTRDYINMQKPPYNPWPNCHYRDTMTFSFKPSGSWDSSMDMLRMKSTSKLLLSFSNLFIAAKMSCPSRHAIFKKLSKYICCRS